MGRTTTVSKSRRPGVALNVPLEAEIQEAVLDWLKTQPAPGFPGLSVHDFTYAVPNGQMIAGSAAERARYMAALKRRGFRVGVSDLCTALPAGGFHGCYIELKRDAKARTSPEQAAWVARMLAAGYYAAVAYGLDAALHHYRNFLAGARPNA